MQQCIDDLIFKRLLKGLSDEIMGGGVLRVRFFDELHSGYWIQQNKHLLFSLLEYKINGLVNIKKLIAIEFIRSKLNPNSKDSWFMIAEGLLVYFSLVVNEKNLILRI